MEDEDFELQLRLEREEKARAEAAAQGPDPYTYTDPNDGTVYEWDHEKRAWFPKINEEFIAMYQANYGYTDPSTSQKQSPQFTKEPAADQSSKSHQIEIAKNLCVNVPSTSGELPVEASGDTATPDKPADIAGSEILKKKGLKNAAQKRAASWFEIDDAHNTKVYVSGLPIEDFNEEKFVELMSRYGMVFKDETGCYKVKLYRGPDGQLKGDGLCTYLKVESVDLAISLLDGSTVGDKVVHVERAKFKLKGQFDPSKKPKQLKKKEKEKLKKKIDKLFAWKPEKLRGERAKCENTVVIKNFFEPKDFDEDARLILEYQKDLRDECESKFGPVKKIVIYDRNPEGVATVTFNEVEHADECIVTMKGRFFAGRQLHASHWDGKERFKINETEEQLEARLKKWDEFLEKD